MHCLSLSPPVLSGSWGYSFDAWGGLMVTIDPFSSSSKVARLIELRSGNYSFFGATFKLQAEGCSKKPGSDNIGLSLMSSWCFEVVTMQSWRGDFWGLHFAECESRDTCGSNFQSQFRAAF